MKKFLPNIKNFLFMNFGILLMAIGIYFFKTPNGFATGGVSGLSLILANIFPVLTQAKYMLIINVLLLILGAIILGKECGVMTVYCSLMLSFENWALEELIPLNGTLTSFPLLELRICDNIQVQGIIRRYRYYRTYSEKAHKHERRNRPALQRLSYRISDLPSLCRGWHYD